jgi:hypothetical protein
MGRKSNSETKTVETSEVTIVEKIEKPIKVIKTKQKLPLDMMVDCANCTHGRLVYVSKRQNGYVLEWTDFGDTQPIELAELVSMKNTYPRFFRDNWIMIDDIDVLDYLGVTSFYKNALKVETFDEFFSLSPMEIKEKISVMTNGMKKTVAFRASELIENGSKVMDSRATISAIEEALGFDLIEK